MPIRTFSYRIAVEGGDATAAQLDAARQAFDAFLGGVARRSPEAQRAFDAFGQAAERAGQRVGTLQAEINRNLNVRDAFGSEKRARDIEAYGAALDNLRARYVPLFAVERQFAREIEGANKALKVGAISAEEHAAALARINERQRAATAALNTSTGAATANAGAVKLQAYQLANLSAQIQDVVVSLGSGQRAFTVLLQQGPQITSAMGGVRNSLALIAQAITPVTVGIGAAAGTVGLLAVGIARLEGEQRALNAIQTGFAATGRAAELSRPQIQALIDEASRLPGVSREAATATVSEFARTRQIGGPIIGDLTRIVGDFAAATGKEVPEAAKELAKSFADPAAGAKALDEQLGILTLRQARTIEQMARSGDRLGAQKELYKALQDRIQGLAREGMTEAQRNAESLGKAWDDMLTSFSRTKPIEQARQLLINLLNFASKAAGPSAPKPRIEQGDIDEALRDLGDFLQRPGIDVNHQGVISRLAAIDEIRRQFAAQNRRAALAAGGERGDFAFAPASGGAGAGAAGAARGDTQAIKELIDSYATLAAQIRKAEADITRLKAAKASLEAQGAREAGVNSDLGKSYAEVGDALERAEAARKALKTPVEQAIAQTEREQTILNASIGTRQAVRAAEEAYARALAEGKKPQEAIALALEARLQAEAQMAAQARDTITLTDAETASALAIAEAWKLGAAAANEQIAAEQAHAETLKNAAVDEKALTATILARKAALDLVQTGQRLDEMRQQTAGLRQIAAAEREGAGAAREAAIQVKVAEFAYQRYAAAIDETADKAEEAIGEFERLTREQDNAARSAETARQLVSREDELEVLRAETALVGANALERAKVVQALRDQIELERKLAGVTDLETMNRIIDEQEELAKVNQQLAEQRVLADQARDNARAYAEPWSHAFEGLGEAVETFVSKSGNALDKLANVGKRLASELVSAFLRINLLNPVGAALGIPGIVNTGGAFVGGGTGIRVIEGQGGTLQLARANDGAGTLLGSGGSLVSNLTGGINNLVAWGNQFSLGGLFPTTQIDALSGLNAGVPGLLPFGLGDALPFIGAALPGLISGNFAQAGVGVAGAGVGAAIGSFIPGIGTAIGAAIGGTLANTIASIFGFGAKKSVGPGVVGLTSFDRGRFEFTGFETDNKGDPAAARQLGEQLTAALQAIRKTADIRIAEGFQFALGFNPTEKYTFNLRRRAEDGTYPVALRTDVKGFETFDDAFIAGLRKAIEQGDFTEVGGDVAKAIANSSARKIEDFAKDVDFAAGFHDALDQMRAGLDPARSQLSEMAKAAKTFGDSGLDAIKQFRDKAVELELATAEEIDPALRAMLEGMLGLAGQAKPLEGLALQIEQTRRNFEALKPALEEAGFSAAEAGDLISQGFARFKNELGDRFLADLGRAANEAMGKGFLNQLGDIGKQADTSFGDALTLFGADDPRLATAVKGINDVFGGLVENVLKGLDAGQLQQIIDAYAEIDTAQGQFIEQMARNELAWRQVTEAAGQATRALTDAGKRLLEDLDVRELALAGDDRAALARKLQLDKERQLDAALAEGFNPDQLARLARVIDGELNQALAEFDRQASEAAAAATRTGQAFASDLAIREKRLAGDTRGAFIVELTARQQAEKDAAIAAGRTTAELQRLAAVLAGEFAQSLAAFDNQVTDAKRRGGLAIEQAINPDFRPEVLDVLLDAGISQDKVAGLAALSVAISGLNADVDSADALRAAGTALDQALADGAISVEQYNGVLGYLTSTYQRAGDGASGAAGAISALEQALAGLRETIAGGFTSSAAVAQLSVSDILAQIAPDVAATLEAPFNDFLAAAGRGSGYLQLAGQLGDTIESLAGSLTPEDVANLTGLVRTIIGIGDARFEDLQRQLDPPPAPPGPDPEQLAREAEERARRAAAINADVMARLLESQGHALEAQLARFDVAAEAQRREAQEVGADLTRLNQVLDAERQAIIDGFAEQAARFNGDLQVRLLRAQGKDLDAQLLAFDQAAEQQRMEARRLNVDLDFLNEVLGLERRKIIDSFQDIGDALEETLKRAIDQFRGYVEGLGFGPTSPLTPEQKLAEAQAAFAETVTRARARDAAAIESLPSVAETLLEQARGFYASGAGFTALFAMTRSTLQQVLAQLGSPTTLPSFATGGRAEPGWALVGEGGAELVRFGRPAQVFPAEVSRRLERSATNDGAGAIDTLGRKLDALADRLDALLRVTAASGDLSVEELRGLRGGIDEVKRKINQRDAA